MNYTNLGSPIVENLLPNSRHARVRRALAKMRGLEVIDAYRGLLAIGSDYADVRLEGNDAVHVRFPTCLPVTPTALETTGHLPGNLRFARNGAGVELLADTRVDGELHLRETFRQVVYGIRSALGQSLRRSSSKTAKLGIEPRDVEAALDELKWDSESLVRHEGAWELRPCVSGESIPVQIKLVDDGADLVISREILPRLPEPGGAQAAACADQSLRFNSQLRLVRLAHSAGTLVCEARLHRGQLQPTWLAMTARAVAFASRHVQLPLRVLAEQETVAQSYTKLFLFCGEPALPVDY